MPYFLGGWGKPPPARLCAQASGLARIRRDPLPLHTHPHASKHLNIPKTANSTPQNHPNHREDPPRQPANPPHRMMTAQNMA